MSRLHSDAAGEFRAAAFVDLLTHEILTRTSRPRNSPSQWGGGEGHSHNLLSRES